METTGIHNHTIGERGSLLSIAEHRIREHLDESFPGSPQPMLEVEQVLVLTGANFNAELCFALRRERAEFLRNQKPGQIVPSSAIMSPVRLEKLKVQSYEQLTQSVNSSTFVRNITVGSALVRFLMSVNSNGVSRGVLQDQL